MDKKIAIRIPEEWMPAIEHAMQRRGVIKVSDFIRQAVTAELNEEDAAAPMAVNFATAATPAPTKETS